MNNGPLKISDDPKKVKDTGKKIPSQCVHFFVCFYVFCKDLRCQAGVYGVRRSPRDSH